MSCSIFDVIPTESDCICTVFVLKCIRIFQDGKIKDASFECCPLVHKEGDAYEHNGGFDFTVSNIHSIDIHR